jgi:hypothetical protein
MVNDGRQFMPQTIEFDEPIDHALQMLRRYVPLR